MTATATATATATLTVTLPQQLETLVRQKVESGRYSDPNAVVADALRLLDDRDRLERLRAEIALGLEDIERGETELWTPELMERIRREAEEDERNGVPIDDDDPALP